ncbi:MAG: hypothetical protein WAQ56_10030 [Candidatus Nitrotoga sp.]
MRPSYADNQILRMAGQDKAEGAHHEMTLPYKVTDIVCISGGWG